MKVVLICFHFIPQGVALATALARHAQVTLIAPDIEAEPYLQFVDKSVDLRLFTKPRARHAVRQVRTLLKLHGWIRDIDPDVLHIHGGHPWLTLSLELWNRYPRVVTIYDAQHHPGDASSRRFPQWVLDRGARQGDEVIVHSEHVKKELIARLGLKAERIHVTHLPRETGDRSVDGEQAFEEEGNILFFGRLWPYKGLQYLIQAEPLITAACPNARFVIAGTGEDMDRYRKMMVHPERFTIHHRYISNEERGELFRRASVVVLPYIEASQSGVVHTAYHYGKPVVATTVGGLPEAVEDGRTGFLVPPADDRKLAHAVVRLLHDKALRHEFGMRAQHKFRHEWSPSAIALHTLDIYRRAITRRHRVCIEPHTTTLAS
jgi:glycosyltransferase involved in cell wall biosynthesis